MSKIKEPAARAAYLALGPGRSIAKLRGVLGEKLGRPPGKSTLELWSSKHGWTKLAAAHDEKVTAAATAQIAAQQGKKAADLVTHLISAAHEGLTRAVAIAGQEAKFKDLVDGSVTALKAAEVLAGGVSDRIENHQRVHLERAKAVREELENLFGPSDQPAENQNGRDPLVH